MPKFGVSIHLLLIFFVTQTKSLYLTPINWRNFEKQFNCFMNKISNALTR